LQSDKFGFFNFNRGVSMFTKTAFIICLSLMTTACFYGERVAPVPLPAIQTEHVNVEGALLLAQAYVDEDRAKAAFGFDVRGAGLLPVRVVVDNQSGGEVRLLGAQTFLIDKEGQAWPLLTAKQANDRVKDNVSVSETFAGTTIPALLLGAAGAAAGVAIGVLSGSDLGNAAAKGAILGGTAGAIYGGVSRNKEVGADIAYDLNQRSLRNEPISAGALAYGFLFFPGLDEARSAQTLRLAISVKGQQRVVNIPLPIEKSN
jgi:hypothetical protein